MPGIFLINKPKGITSHDVVNYLRRVTGEKTIGHAGTLDPLASGLMIVAVGREFTRQISNFSKLDKTYLVEATLGATSTTYDAEGVITPARHSESSLRHPELDSGSLAQIPDQVRNDGIAKPNQEKVNKTLQSFVGRQNQMPPIFSAKKIGGQKAYDLARQGKPVELKAVPVNIYEIKLSEYHYPILKFSTKVSSGTYIRSLVHDIGQKLGSGAYMSGLIRDSIGEFKLSEAMDLYQIKSLADLHPHQLPLNKGESRGSIIKS
ncbi:TPA: tRNA pseudouridine(55) synthase TruB [Patescibacteria group bacterium]|nr:tRNA pseudouridine(55) synthase TruB [Patescibacteria group bacterium]